MKSRLLAVIMVVVMVTSINGCGSSGGGGGSNPVAAVDSSQNSSLVGDWFLSKEDRDGDMLPVLANVAGQLSKITFFADNTFLLESYERTSSSEINHWQTKDVGAEITSGTFAYDGSLLILTAGSATVTHSVTIENNTFTQTNQHNEIYLWQKSP